MNQPLQTFARCLACAVLIGTVGAAGAAPGDQPVTPLPAAPSRTDPSRVHSSSLPARGLFVGDQLSDAAKARLSEMIVEAMSMRVEVALVVPEGPWQIDPSGKSESDLTPARLAAVRRFLADRGVNPRHIFVESHIDKKLKEPRLEVQLVTGEPADD